MRTIIEVISGSAVGRTARLDEGERFEVGRSDFNDMAFPRDGLMSASHFAVTIESDSVYVVDLGSSNGTFVNSEPVQGKVALDAGDEILAGATAFRVRKEGSDTLRDTAKLGGDEASAATAAAPVSPAFTVERCDSGLTLCSGTVDDIEPVELAQRLDRAHALHMIVDLNRLSVHSADACCDYLFDWLEPEVAARVSPVLISRSDREDWEALLEAGWGEDAVVCLFSNSDRAELLAHLRQAARATHRGGEPRGVLGYCWPSVMALLLAHNQPDFVRRLLAGIEAVLLEFPDFPESWQILGEAGVVEWLRDAGLVRMQAVV